MKFNLSQIKFSKKDLIKNIKIPVKLTEELAEDIGNHVGDGSLYRHSDDGHFEFAYSGNISEKEYMNYIIALKRKLYNINKISRYVYGNEYRIYFYSLALATFYSKIIGLPIGKKKDIDVPDVIKISKNKKIIAAFLRGLIDTDFSLVVRRKYGNFCPTLEGASASKYLIISLYKLFKKLGIESILKLNVKQFDNRTKKYYIINKILIRRKDEIIKSLRTIKPRNKKYQNKIKKMGLWRFEFWN